MKKIDRIFKQLSDLYEFNRKIKSYRLRKKKLAGKSFKKDMAKGRHAT